jgi:hypothetical protein
VVFGEACGDGGEVAAQACGQGVQVGQVVGLHLLEPGVESLAAVFVHQVGEVAHVSGGGGQFRAGADDGGQLGAVVGIEVVGVGHDPSGDPAWLGHRGPWPEGRR